MALDEFPQQNNSALHNMQLKVGEGKLQQNLKASYT